MADERDCSKYPIARSNLHNVREQISTYLCDIDERITNSVDEAWATGLVDGGELNIVNVDNIEVIGGAGVIIDSYTDPRSVPIRTYLSWDTQSEPITLLPHPAGTTIFFMIEDTGTAVGAPIDGTNLGRLTQHTSQPTPAQVRDNVFLGYAVYNGDFWKEVSSPNVINNSIHTLSEYLRSVAGAFFIESGGKITEFSTLSLSRDEGVYWEQNRAWHVDRKDPNRESFPQEIGFQWRYINFDFSYVSALTADADFANYDDLGGSIVPIGGAVRTTTIQRLYVDTADNYWMQYGQVLHDNFIEAIASIGSDQTDTIFPDVGFGSRILGYVIAERNSTGWTQEKAEFVTATEGSIGTGAGSGVTDHDQLNKILPDDHHDKLHTHDGIDGSGTVAHSSTTGRTVNDHHRQVHKLYGQDGDGVNQHSDVSIVAALVERHLLAWNNLNVFVPEFRMNWRGFWGQQEYQTHDVVLDIPYTMAANKPTTDRAAPQPIGNPAYMYPDEPLWVDGSNASSVYSGHVYNFTETVEVVAFRVWIPTVSANISYRIVYIQDPFGSNPVYKTIEDPTLRPDEWTIVGVSTELVIAGTEFLIYIDAINSGSDITWAYNWLKSTSSNTIPPLDGNWNTNVQQSLLRINWLDAETIPIDHQLELQVVPDTVFEISEIGSPEKLEHYRVNGAYTEGGDWTEYNVTLIRQENGGCGVGVPTQVRAVQPVPDPTEFVYLPDQWLNNQPVWGTIQSYLAYDGVDQGVDPNTGYGLDIAVQQLVISPDWDVVASFGTGGGGGEGEPFPEVEDDGITYGREFGLWNPVYTKDQADAVFQERYDWIIEQNDRTAAWGERIRFDTPPNFCQLPLPDQDVTGVVKLDDILIWNDGNITDQIIEVRPAAGTYFTFNGVDKPVDEPALVKTGEVIRVQTRATGTSYGLAIEAAARFDGADSFGFVSNDDGLETGRYLSDAGTWQDLTVIPTGGIRFEYKFSTDIAISDPAAGYVKINNADPNLPDTMSFSDLTRNGNSIRVWGAQLRVGDFLGIVDQTNGISYYYRVSGNVIDHTTWYEAPIVVYYVQAGLIPDQQLLSLALIGDPKSRLPTGGDENWVLAKASSLDFDTHWVDLDLKYPLDNVPQDGWTYGRYWDGDSLEWNTGAVDPVAFSGDVGIGTTSVGEKVHIRDATAATYIRIEDAVGYMNIGQNSAGNTIIYNYANAPMRFGTNGTERMRITADGDVGIGMTAPDPNTKLHVRTSSVSKSWIAAAGISNFIVERSGSSVGMTLLSSTNNVGYLNFADPDDENAGFISYNHSNNAMTFRTNGGGEDMRITADGYVGIGTANPLYQLDVKNKNTNLFAPIAKLTSSGLAAGEWARFDIVNSFHNTSFFAFVTNVDSYWRTDDTNMRFQTYGAHIMSFGTNGTEDMRIDTAGNVGIGVTAPAYKMDINGDVNLRAGWNYRIDGQPIIREGTWTPQFVNNPPTNAVVNPSSYQRVGNWVRLIGYVGRGTGGTNTSQMRVGNLPFSVAPSSSVMVGRGNVTDISEADFGGSQNTDGVDVAQIGCVAESASQSLEFYLSISLSSEFKGGNREDFVWGSWLSGGRMGFIAEYVTDDP